MKCKKKTECEVPWPGEMIKTPQTLVTHRGGARPQIMPLSSTADESQVNCKLTKTHLKVNVADEPI